MPLLQRAAARFLCAAAAAAAALPSQAACAGDAPPLPPDAPPPPPRAPFSALHSTLASSEGQFVDHDPGPAKLRLKTTPHESAQVHEPTRAGLARLQFLCNRCGAVIAPAGSVWRTTVAPTPIVTSPDHSQLTGLKEDVQDSVFASEAAAAHVRRLGDDRPHLYGKAANTAAYVFHRVGCRGCGLHVGMCVRDERTGAFVRYKFISFREHRGWLLRLAEPQAWLAMQDDVPPVPLRPTAPRNLERAERSSHALPAARGPMTPGAAVEATNALLNDGLQGAYLRAVRANEAAGALGLHPKNAAARAAVAEHVTHGSKPAAASQYTSLSEDPSVPLLWALPYGRVVVIAPALARALAGGRPPSASDMFITNEGLQRALQGEGQGQREARALAYAQRSKEALAVGAVAADAVDELQTHFVRLRAPAAVHPPAACADFPATVHELAQLAETAVAPRRLPADAGAPPLLPADMGASLLALADAPGPSFVVLRMSRNSLPAPGGGGAGGGTAGTGGAGGALALALALEEAIAQGRAQLRAAVEAYAREGWAERWPVAYYEADVEYAQPRRATDRIPVHGQLQGLPFLLLRLPEGAGAEWGAFREALVRLHQLKKGNSL